MGARGVDEFQCGAADLLYGKHISLSQEAPFPAETAAAMISCPSDRSKLD
jgi:hypothetical protein